MTSDVSWPKLGSFFYRRGSHDYRVRTLRCGKTVSITVDTEKELREELDELVSFLRGDHKLMTYPKT